MLLDHSVVVVGVVKYDDVDGDDNGDDKNDDDARLYCFGSKTRVSIGTHQVSFAHPACLSLTLSMHVCLYLHRCLFICLSVSLSVCYILAYGATDVVYRSSNCLTFEIDANLFPRNKIRGVYCCHPPSNQSVGFQRKLTD